MKLNAKINEIEVFLEKILKEPSFKNDISLFTGIGGAPIFFFLLYKYKNDESYLNKIDEFIEYFFEYLNNNENQIGLTYCDGLCGLGQMLNFLHKKNALQSDPTEALEAIDDILYNNIELFLSIVDELPHEKKAEQIDFLHGVFGIAYYLLSRPKNDNEFKLIRLFDKLAEIVKDGCKLASCVKDEVEINDSIHKTNLGLAHGNISYILILSEFLKIYPEKENIKDTIKHSAYTVFSFKNDDENSNYKFPGIAINKISAIYDNIHLGWCYGDQTVSFGLYKAGVAINDSFLIEEAQKIAHTTLNRQELSTAHVFDSEFCHGASSVAYFHRKWYTITKNESFLSAYNHFLEEALKLCSFDGGIAGFKKYDGPNKYRNAIGMLDGLIGVGIFLLDAQLNNEEPDWESFFLLN
ncbi:lanthionine synthetase C family protein [Chryseobacterium hispalense]|uniref:lanthionine synthetase C family protein n=1 Tax=Chryseobacterium hispalense TaxID=1453492 RepID=UPI0004932ED5|nr:lanthionine synthetase C family protein [Chryseobacterium hispalense]